MISLELNFPVPTKSLERNLLSAIINSSIFFPFQFMFIITGI
jgi:hypothetical protein